MIMPPDPFAQSFDSIEVARAPSPAAIESALHACAAPDDGRPGFFLLDDAEGRFVVDREMGVVMLRDDALLARERGAVYSARLRVVEPSGVSYDLDMQLRITGRVPQVVGSEDFSLGPDTAPNLAAAPRDLARVAWTRFAAALGAQTPSRLRTDGAYGSLLSAPIPATNDEIRIAFGETIPAPAPPHASWPY